MGCVAELQTVTSDDTCLGTCSRSKDARVGYTCLPESFSFSSYLVHLQPRRCFFTSIYLFFLKFSCVTSYLILIVSALSCASIFAIPFPRFASYRGALSLASFATNSAIASAFLSSISEDTLMDLLTLDWPEIMDLLTSHSMTIVRLFQLMFRVLVNA